MKSHYIGLDIIQSDSISSITVNWKLMSHIHSLINMLVEHKGWDLSQEEVTSAFKSFCSINDLPENYLTDDLVKVYEQSYIDIWGKDHEIVEVSSREIKLLEEIIHFYRK